jgi:acetyltransferase
MLASWLGTRDFSEASAIFAQAGIPTYATPADAVRGAMHLARYRQGQKAILEVPQSQEGAFAPDEGRARKIVDAAIAGGQTWLDPTSVNGLFGCYGIPIARSAVAATPEEASAIAAGWGVPVALKAVSPAILHKSDVGGVVLDLTGAAEVDKAARAMIARIGERVPEGLPIRFQVQEMIPRKDGFELIMGFTVDRQFGPVLLFGQGGVAVELIADKALALPPLNLRLAKELIGQTRVSKLLAGYRGRKAADIDAIALTLVKLSQLVCDLDAVQEVDLNPVLASETGVICVDARVRVAAMAGEARGMRLAIRPYPRECERDELLPKTGKLRLRPIRPEDAARLTSFIAGLAPETARIGFFSPMRHLDASMIARLTQIDYDREMAFVLSREEEPERLIGVARLFSDPDNIRAEFTLAVASQFHRQGIGKLLMTRLIAYARARGTSEMFGDMQADNAAMRGLCAGIGFSLESRDASTIRATLALARSNA